MKTFRWILRYKDQNSGLGWSLSGYISKVDANAVQLAANTWNSLYMAACSSQVVAVDLRVSDVLLWGDQWVYPGEDFDDPQGLIGTAIMPLAECVIVKGYTNVVGNEGRSMWKLHGLAAAKFNADGSLNRLDPNVGAIQLGSNGLLWQYRKTPTPVHGLPIVDPPVPYTQYLIEGPYVRRLGNPFFLAGQRARYTRTRTPG